MRQKQPWCCPNTWWSALLNMKPVHLQITSPFINWGPFWRDLDHLVCLVSVADGKKKRWRLQSDLGVSKLFHKSGRAFVPPCSAGCTLPHGVSTWAVGSPSGCQRPLRLKGLKPSPAWWCLTMCVSSQCVSLWHTFLHCDQFCTFYFKKDVRQLGGLQGRAGETIRGLKKWCVKIG